MHEETRAQKRKNIIYQLEVHDYETGVFLGWLVDLTTKGLKLVSEHPLEVNRIRRLKITLPPGYFMQQEFCFEAKSMWCTKDVNPDYYATGFFTPNLEAVNPEIARNLINHLSFND